MKVFRPVLLAAMIGAFMVGGTALSASVANASSNEVAASHAGVDKSDVLAAGEKLYKAACVACHSTGVAKAPKLGDKSAWQPLIDRGMDSMMEITLNGKGAMPARGATKADDATLRAAVEYMISTVN